MGIYSILVAALAGIAIVGASFFVVAQNQNAPTERTRASSFSGPINVFDIFNRPDTSATLPNKTDTKTQQADNASDDRAALQALADAWQKRRLDLEKALPAPRAVTTTPRPTEPADVFTSLLGPKLTEALNTHSGTTQPAYTSTSFNGESALWGGTGDVAPAQPVRPIETTYAIQTELHDYGNILGATLDGFVAAQGDQAALLDTYLHHRTDAVAQAQLKSLTDAYTELSNTLHTIVAPAPLTTTHKTLFEGYARIGTELYKITDATTDGELYNKLIAYNAVAEEVARAHVAVVTVLKAYGVTFAPGEPGNAFVFDGR